MRRLALAAFPALLLAPLAAVAGPPQPAALVFAISGAAFRSEPNQAHRPVHLFDRLPAGTVLEVGSGSRIALAFASGKRWSLGEGARARVTRCDLADRSGSVRELPAAPPLPLFPALEAGERPGPRAGAIRIRGEEISGLYPARGATALAATVVLRFHPLEGAGRYRVEVEDERGTTVYGEETPATGSLSLPANALQPGTSYHWTVRTVDRPGPLARGEADFMTLDEAAARAREELRRAAAAAPGHELTALLAGVDRDLGLLAEAREELRAALAAAPGDSALTAALADLDHSIEERADAKER
jgi:hypothetical protein